MLNRNQDNMPASYHFGLKILFDGYLIASGFLSIKPVIFNAFLFDSHLIKEKL